MVGIPLIELKLLNLTFRVFSTLSGFLQLNWSVLKFPYHAFKNVDYVPHISDRNENDNMSISYVQTIGSMFKISNMVKPISMVFRHAPFPKLPSSQARTLIQNIRKLMLYFCVNYILLVVPESRMMVFGSPRHFHCPGNDNK